MSSSWLRFSKQLYLISVVLVLFVEISLTAAAIGFCSQDDTAPTFNFNDLKVITSTFVNSLLWVNNNNNNKNSDENDTQLAQDIQFWCIKPGSNDFHQMFVNQLNNGTIDEYMPLSFVVHGYLASRQNSPWMERIARAWSANHKRSVCLVDWHRLAAFNYVIVSLKYTRIVGEYMAKLIESLRPSTRLADISIVGHSLGAHVAGYCGQALNGSIGFIYGLDAAGPLFAYPLLTQARRLQANDAKHVQVLHTDRLFGIPYAFGTSDYYANVAYRQPGCFWMYHTCGHMKSVQYFESSLLGTNAFVGRHCDDDDDALNNRCSERTDRFGVFGKHSHGRFYFQTSSCYPYCWKCRR